MFYVSIVRASYCYKIGCIEFGNRVLVLNDLLVRYKARHKYQEIIGIHCFYFLTNGHNRHWLFNESYIYDSQTIQIGGFYQIIDVVYVLDLDSALVPTYFYPNHINLSFLDLHTMFIWMSTYIKIIEVWGFKPVTSEIKKISYINLDEFPEFSQK